jgi:hypothetical protein
LGVQEDSCDGFKLRLGGIKAISARGNMVSRIFPAISMFFAWRLDSRPL